jgi:hypothetical protein
MAGNPFLSIESAHVYVRLLREQVAEVETTVADDIAALSSQDSRRHDALRLVAFKLAELDRHLAASSRTLNDLRALRRLLFEEREEGLRAEAPVAGHLSVPGEAAASTS